MALHEQSVGKSDEWYTPKYVFDALGARFDMDVASPHNRTHIATPALRWLWEDSLSQQWTGFVWMNPPFGGRNGIEPWLDKFFLHANGIALTPDRTSAPRWQTAARKADAILFVAGKIKFIGPDGQPGNSPAQGTTLMAVGDRALDALHMAQSRGLGLFLS